MPPVHSNFLPPNYINSDRKAHNNKLLIEFKPIPIIVTNPQDSSALNDDPSLKSPSAPSDVPIDKPSISSMPTESPSLMPSVSSAKTDHPSSNPLHSKYEGSFLTADFNKYGSDFDKVQERCMEGEKARRKLQAVTKQQQLAKNQRLGETKRKLSLKNSKYYQNNREKWNRGSAQAMARYDEDPDLLAKKKKDDNHQKRKRRKFIHDAKVHNRIYPSQMDRRPDKWKNFPTETHFGKASKFVTFVAQRIKRIAQHTPEFLHDPIGKTKGFHQSITAASMQRVVNEVIALCPKNDKGRRMNTLDLGHGLGKPSIQWSQYYFDHGGLHVGIDFCIGSVNASNINIRAVTTKALNNQRQGYFDDDCVQREGELHLTRPPNVVFERGDIVSKFC